MVSTKRGEDKLKGNSSTTQGIYAINFYFLKNICTSIWFMKSIIKGKYLIFLHIISYNFHHIFIMMMTNIFHSHQMDHVKWNREAINHPKPYLPTQLNPNQKYLKFSMENIRLIHTSKEGKLKIVIIISHQTSKSRFPQIS